MLSILPLRYGWDSKAGPGVSRDGDSEGGVCGMSPASLKLKSFSSRLKVSREGVFKTMLGRGLGEPGHELTSEELLPSADWGEFACRPLCFALIWRVRPAFDRKFPLHHEQTNAFSGFSGESWIVGRRGILRGGWRIQACEIEIKCGPWENII